MSLLSATHVSQSFGAVDVFKGRFQEYTTRRTVPDEPHLAKRKRSSTSVTVYNHRPKVR